MILVVAAFLGSLAVMAGCMLYIRYERRSSLPFAGEYECNKDGCYAPATFIVHHKEIIDPGGQRFYSVLRCRDHAGSSWEEHHDRTFGGYFNEHRRVERLPEGPS